MLHDNAMIADDALPQLYDKLQAIGKRERIDLLMYARGGIPEVCWRALNLLREHCDHLGVIVGTRVQGAGSLLALGADEIVMGPLSEVGGVEAARKHPLLPRDDMGQPIPMSLGEIRSLFPASEGSTPDLAGLYPYIHPLVIANLQQADMLARDVTRKALQTHMHPEDRERVEQLVELFNGGFHSPMYTAGRNELRDAGLPVTEPDEELWGHIWGLVQLYQSAIYIDRPDPGQPGAFFRYVCIIESAGRSTGLRQAFTQVEGQERVLQIRWETAIRGPGPGPSIGPGGLSNN
jgi:hypothetical protein